MRISAISTSFNYSDTLSITAKTNKHIFDDWTIITLKGDDDTPAICDQYGIKCIILEGDFNKGRMMNAGLKSLSNPDWILFVDPDIILPYKTREFLENKNLHPKRLYGANRKILGRYRDFRKFYVSNDCSVLRKERRRKDAIIGYFQLFQSNSLAGKMLQERPGAASIDVEFSDRWHPMMQEMLDLDVYHLGRVAKNWSGKQTRHFGPKIKRFKINASI